MSNKLLQQLQARYIDGEPLTDEEQRSLLQWLSDFPEQRQEMLTDEMIASQLRCMARLNDNELAETFVQETIQRAAAWQPRKNVRDVTPVRREKRTRSMKWYAIPAGLGTAALVLVAAAVTWHLATPQRRDDFGFAHIVNTRDLSWELTDKESRQLQITSGYGEVHFENGVIAQLAAPSVIELKAPGKMFLKSGSARIDVPPAAVGFTVETPLARIVDFGTTFDVDVAETKQTEARVRSGVVTFETHTMSLRQRKPVKLTVEGLNRASAEVSELSSDVRSVVTTARGSDGQFLGTVDAGGQSVEFHSRKEFDNFLNRLRTSLEKNSAPFSEQWKAAAQTPANPKSEGPGGGASDDLPAPRPNRSQQMLIEQLRSMREFQRDNPQMQELLDRMIRQAEEAHE